MTACSNTSPLELVDADARASAAPVAGLSSFLLGDFDAAIHAYARVTGSAQLVPGDTRTVAIFGGLPTCVAWTAAQASVREHLCDAPVPPRLYLVAYVPERVDAAACAAANEQMEQAALAGDLDWCGGCLIGRAGALACLVHTPRMGFWRRPVAEACDRVIGAARLGLPLPIAAQIAGTDAMPPVVAAQTSWPLTCNHVL